MYKYPSFLLVLMLGVVACGGSRTQTAAPGTTEVTVGFTKVLNTVSGNDRSGPEDSKYDAIDSNTRGYLRLSSCGTIGLMYRKLDKDGDTQRTSLAYYGVDAAGAGAEQILATENSWSSLKLNGSLAFDADCAPHVFRASDDTYSHWSMDGGNWVSEDLDLGLEALLGDTPSNITHLYGDRAPDGKVHLIFEAWAQGDKRLIHATDNGGTWSAVTLPTLQDTMPDPNMKDFLWRFYDFAVDAGGGVHVGFNWDRHLYYGKLAGGAWQPEAVKERSGFDQEAAVGASLAVGPDGRPAIAATFAQRVSTGSWEYMDLRYYERSEGGSWSDEILVTEADGYVGGDGNYYTGYDPHLVFDGEGRAHIAFNDLSSWHFLLTDDFSPDAVNANDYLGGQVRYVFHNGGAWEYYTLYEQPGQSASPNPLEDLPHPTIAVSANGGLLALAGMERIIHGTTLRFDTTVDVDYSMILMRANNAVAQ